MKRSYAVIVIGAGGLGSAAAYRLARAGTTDVLVLEQFALGHDRGASEDHSRIIRHAYHSAAYTPLTRAMFEAWAEVEDEAGLRLVTTTGGLNLAVIGTPGESVLEDYERTLAPGLAIERLEAAEIRRRWPQWQIGDDVRGLFQERGGILDIRRATATHIVLARAHGVSFMPGSAVRRVRSTDDAVAVVTDTETYRAEALVICAGSWTPALLDGLGVDLPITLSQEQVSYFATAHPREFACERFPIWIWHGEDVYYGFPVYGEVAVKAARDMTGRFIEPHARSYEPLPEETALVARFLEARLPRAAGPELYSKTCVYDMPPDRDFVIDLLPGHPRIAIAIGAGHAGKFASLIGEILAELVLDGASRHPIEAFRADRPALTDPGFARRFRLAG